MTISICRNCRHEQSDCKGVKSIDTVRCDYFEQNLAIDYKKDGFGITSARIKELEYELDICQAKAYEYDKLYDKYVELVADNKTLMQKNTSEYELNEALLLRADRLEAERNELKAENKKLKAKIEQRVECGADCDKCKNKCRAWQNGFNAKGGNISFDSIQMLRRIVKEVEPEWIDNNCISCAWFNNLKGVGGYCAYHNNKTTAKGGCNKWAKECDAE